MRVRWPWQPRGNPLGEGVWRRAHDGFRRAVDRYHQVIEPVPDGTTRASLDRTGAELAALLEAVLELCLEAQRHAPSAGHHVPGGSRPDGSRADGSRADGSRADGSRADGSWADVHRSLTRAATCVAQAAEAAAMARVAVTARNDDEAQSSCAAARRAADQAVRLVAAAGPPVRGTGSGRRTRSG